MGHTRSSAGSMMTIYYGERVVKKILPILILILSLVGGAGYFGFKGNEPEPAATPEAPETVAVSTCDVTQSVSAPGNLINTGAITLNMPADGRLAEVLVQPGDSVSAGEILARLDDIDDFTAAVASARLELLQAQDGLEELVKNTPLETAEAHQALVDAQAAKDEAERKRTALDHARADDLDIEAAETDYLFAKQAYKEALKAFNHVADKKLTNPERAAALQALVDAEDKMNRALAIWNWLMLPASETDIAGAQTALDLAEAKLAQAQAQWDRLTNGNESLEVELAEARIAEAQARLDSAEKTLENIEMRAPFDGVILEVDAEAGQTLQAGNKLIVLNDPTSMEVEATVVEEDYPYVEVGQPVDLYFDALPEAEVKGTVTRILPKRAEGDRPLYSIYVSLDQVPDKLAEGMSADASVAIAQVQGALCLPRGVVSASSENTAIVEVWTGDHKDNREITVGLRGDVYVEILDGLEEGEEVVAQ